ncbi:MAG: CPBP family intramembrane metalloprotease [Bacteroidetes bacterium]|nr:CPBP family intramembrane metalloprotease [Bacteroidota bacterium]HET6243759.1 CPBP family intramembrane glutamic endopeptidase [Bacteroidia bacterium]
MLQKKLSEETVMTKLFVLLLIAFGSLFVFSFLAVLLIEPIFGVNIAEATSLVIAQENHLALNALKFMQLLNAIGIFIVPPIVFVMLVTNNKLKYLNLNTAGPSPILYLIIPAIMLGGMPLINFMAEINNYLQFPEWLSGVEKWMKASEESAKQITTAFLQVDNIQGLLYNVLLIAVIPAVGEELLFRGVLQRLINQGTNSKHWGIWIAAFLFSALHMQFYGFLPRFVMGAAFGYMLVWSGSLWTPIFAHFVNNGAAVLVSYLIYQRSITPEIEHIGEGEGQALQVATSAIVVFALLWLFYSISIKEKKASGELSNSGIQ